MVDRTSSAYTGKQKKISDWLWLGIGIMLILILNAWASRNFFRIDLTADQRFTITEGTQNLLQNLDDVVYIDVYLEGEMPAGFKRLKRSIRENLEEFKNYGGQNIQYRFVDPALAGSERTRNEFYQSLATKGIQPTNIFDNEEGKRTERLVFPGAVVSYGGREKGVTLLKGNAGATPEERLNQSAEGIEYELASTIQSLTATEPPVVGWLSGHGEVDSIQVASIQEAISTQYTFKKLGTSQLLNELPQALIIAKPSARFSEEEKLQLDQYLLGGGKILLAMDGAQVEMDSLTQGGNLAIPQVTGLQDLLFNWGIRLNKNLVQDLSSGAYPIVVGNMGNQPQVRFLRWPFFPILNNYGNHPIVRNLDAIYGRFVSNLDTVRADGIVKTPLVYTSEYTRVFNLPLRISIEDLRKELQPQRYNQGRQTVAYLLEGNFTSLYQNRIRPQGIADKQFKSSGQSKLIVVADGNFMVNEINNRTNQAYPLGYAAFTQQTFANQEFIMNSLAYLIQGDELILARNKEVAIRPLDNVRLEGNELFWQLLNMVVPVILIMVLGLGYIIWRKHRYARF